MNEIWWLDDNGRRDDISTVLGKWIYWNLFNKIIKNKKKIYLIDKTVLKILQYDEADKVEN